MYKISFSTIILKYEIIILLKQELLNITSREFIEGQSCVYINMNPGQCTNLYMVQQDILNQPQLVLIFSVHGTVTMSIPRRPFTYTHQFSPSLFFSSSLKQKSFGQRLYKDFFKIKVKMLISTPFIFQLLLQYNLYVFSLSLTSLVPKQCTSSDT